MTRDAPITALYFPVDAVVSVVSTLADGTRLEVATIGNEGLLGVPRFLQADTMPFTAFVQVPGAALRMAAADFHQAVGAVGSAWGTQLSQHVVCNGHHRVVQRCTRWLLQTHDRVGRATFPLTQKLLAMMVGVQRPSVTAVARHLQQAGLIEYQRGLIHVLDRPGLEAASCECYGVIRREMDRLLGPVYAEGLAGEADGHSS